MADLCCDAEDTGFRVTAALKRVILSVCGSACDAPYFSVTCSGRSVLTLRGYRYYRNHRASGAVATYFCSRQCSADRCKASVRVADNVIVDQPTFTTSRFGKPVIVIGRYRFNKYCRSRGPKAKWVCSLGSSRCRASLTTFEDIIVKINNKHSH
ncbi:FLYWCH zinc finger domain-containing protein [Phthorimaea operculella]|nr:FLYWCH zinc finger domain-containing protein [Phthorimaea operculella]